MRLRTRTRSLINVWRDTRRFFCTPDIVLSMKFVGALSSVVPSPGREVPSCIEYVRVVRGAICRIIMVSQSMYSSGPIPCRGVSTLVVLNRKLQVLLLRWATPTKPPPLKMPRLPSCENGTPVDLLVSLVLQLLTRYSSTLSPKPPFQSALTVC